MTAIDFPDTPSVNDIFVVGNRTWRWTGEVWESARVEVLGATGPTGPEGGSLTLTTKGDVLTRSESSLTRLPVGTDSHVLVADSAQTAGLKWDLVDESSIATSVAGSGLAGGAGTALSVNVDDSTIEINADTLRVKDLGVVTAKIADDAVTSAKIADDAVTSAKIAAPTLTAKTDTFTLALVDENCTMQCNKATAMTVTVPTSSVAFANGTVVTLMQYGAGQVTVAPGSGVTIGSSNGFKLRTQYSMATLVKISDTEWVLSGDTVV
jgi:hypothetical protein